MFDGVQSEVFTCDVAAEVTCDVAAEGMERVESGEGQVARYIAAVESCDIKFFEFLLAAAPPGYRK